MVDRTEYEAHLQQMLDAGTWTLYEVNSRWLARFAICDMPRDQWRVPSTDQIISGQLATQCVVPVWTLLTSDGALHNEARRQQIINQVPRRFA